MTDPALRGAIAEAVTSGFDEQLRVTADLVRIPSRRGAEAPAQDMIAALLRARGYAVDRWRIDPDDIRHLPGFSPVDVSYENAYSVVGALRCAEPQGRSLILQGHCDVVPEGPHEMWETPPFEPVIRGGWMHGRGAGDMKSGTIAALFAVDALHRAGLRPDADLFLQSVIEEECTGNGALSTLQRGYRADAVLVPEATDFRLTRAQVGVIWFRVRVRGRPVHVAHAPSGSNAIRSALAIAESLDALAAEWNARARHEPHFEQVEHPINFNLGKIAGGDWASSVPAWCDLDCRIAILPSQSIANAQAEIEAAVRRAAANHPFLSNAPPEVIWNGFLADGYVLDNGAEAVDALRAAHTAVLGTALREASLTSLNDTRFYGRYFGIPALCYGARAENYHGFDERVEIASLRQVTEIIALFIAGWCGVRRG